MSLRTVSSRLVDSFRPPEAEASLVAHAPALTVRQLLRRFRPDLRAVRGWLTVSLLLTLVSPVLNAAEIWLFKLLVDHVLVPKDLSAFPPLALAYVGFTLAEGALGFADRLVASATTNRFVHRLRTRSFVHLQALGPEYLERHRLGDLLARISGDVSAIESLLLGGLTKLVSNAVQIIFFTAMLIYLNWRLALAAFVTAPLLLLLSRTFSHSIKQAARERRRRSGSLSAAAESSLRAARLVTAYGAQADQAEFYARESTVSVRAEMASARLRGLYSPLVNLLELCGVLGVVWVGANELSKGRLTLGGMLVFIAYFGELNGPIRGMGSLGNSVSSAAAGAERLAELLDAEPTVRQPARPIVLDRPRGDLRLDAVTYSYPSAIEPALRGVSLSVAAGETIAVMGESGSGKSTLVAVLLRLIDPQRGTASLDGVDLRRLDLGWLRGVSALAMQDAPDARMWDALRAAGAEDFVARLEGGLDAVIGQRGRRLSGGQQARIGVARALLRDAPILVLDEPTVGLDAVTADRLLDGVMERARGRTVVMVTHDPRVARRAQRVVTLARGRVLDQPVHVYSPLEAR